MRDAGAPIAYVWVDALRFELGTDLATVFVPTVTASSFMQRSRPRRRSRLSAWLISPSNGEGLSLELARHDLAIRVDGTKVATVPDRVARLRAAHGDKVLDRTLETVAGQGEKELKRALGDADLLLVRSQELDAAGESGMLNAAWSQFTAVLDLLRNLVARLGQAGVRRIVITADHGFVTLSAGARTHRADRSSHRRDRSSPSARLGRQGSSTTESTLRVPLASTGVPSDARPDRASRARCVPSGRIEAVLPRRAFTSGACRPGHRRRHASQRRHHRSSRLMYRSRAGASRRARSPPLCVSPAISSRSRSRCE